MAQLVHHAQHAPWEHLVNKIGLSSKFCAQITVGPSTGRYVVKEIITESFVTQNNIEHTPITVIKGIIDGDERDLGPVHFTFVHNESLKSLVYSVDETTVRLCVGAPNGSGISQNRKHVLLEETDVD